MNFIGNTQNLQYLQSIIQHTQGGFILVAGPQYVGKTTAIQRYINQIISPFHLGSDYIFLQDLSDQRIDLKELNDKLTGNEHTIRVDSEGSKRAITREDGSTYIDYGARDVLDWLSRSPIGAKKLLHIENIERMTTQASNAFLKTLEEPLENRLIIASSSAPESLLDTIRSRATLVKFNALSEGEIIHHHLDPLSMGRPGLDWKIKNNQKYQQLYTTLQQINEIRRTQEPISKKQSLFAAIYEGGLLQIGLDMLLYKHSDNPIISEKLYQTKKLLTSNVGVNNIIMNLCLP